MKGNKIAIDRYLETGEVVDSLDLSVNYLVKNVKEGGTVPLVLKNTLTFVDGTVSVNQDLTYEGGTSSLKNIKSIKGDCYQYFKGNRSQVGNEELLWIDMPNLKDWGSGGSPVVFYKIHKLRWASFPSLEAGIRTPGGSDGRFLSFNPGNGVTVNVDWMEFGSLPGMSKNFLQTISGTVVVGWISINSVNCSLDTSSHPILQNCGAIYVPDSSVSYYKTATNWSIFSDKIYPMSQRPTPVKTRY